MKNKGLIGYKAGEELKKAINLQKAASNFGTSYKNAIEMRKQKNEAFNKFQFFKSLNRAMNEVQK